MENNQKLDKIPKLDYTLSVINQGVFYADFLNIVSRIYSSLRGDLFFFSLPKT